MNMSDAPSARLNDAEIARRALKLLAERKIVPTPQTFADACAEITGSRATVSTPVAVLRDVLRDLVKAGRLSSQEAVPLAEAAQAQNWTVVRDGFDRALARRAGGAAASWPQLTVSLLKQADALHANWTRARKLDAVARVIEGAGEQPDVALERLTRLIESWGAAMPSVPGGKGGPSDALIRNSVAPPPAPAAAMALPAAAAHAIAGTRPAARLADRPSTELHRLDADRQTAHDRALVEAEAWKQVALRASQLLAVACGDSTPAALKLTEYVQRIAQHNADTAVSGAEGIAPRFVDMVTVIERQLGEELKVRLGLQRLLAMLCDNIKSLSPDEVWLAGQLEPIRALLAGPLAAKALEQAELRLAQIIATQGHARRGLQEAKVALKEMLSTLIESIGAMNNTTGTFYEQIGGYQKELESATDIETLSRVASGLLADTARVRSNIESSRVELDEARRKVDAYEARVQELERELTQVSSLVQKDPLTFALNRRGLESAFRVEAARAARYTAPLAVVVIDIDDFKRLNDSLGHVVGDRALVHLATTLQTTLRPTDFIARLGGEEFALLLPATDLNEAFDASERLRRELAQRPFMWDGVPRSITFSAGVAQWRDAESLEDLVQRADGAMYQAKRAGKNRVTKAS